MRPSYLVNNPRLSYPINLLYIPIRDHKPDVQNDYTSNRSPRQPRPYKRPRINWTTHEVYP